MIHGNGEQKEDEEGDSIWVGWDPMIWDGKIKSTTRQHVHCNIKNLERGLHIKVIVIYGRNDKMEREALWEEPQKIKASGVEGMWIIMGDFYEIRHVDERTGQCVFDVEGANTFNEVIEDVDVKELGSIGATIHGLMAVVGTIM